MGHGGLRWIFCKISPTKHDYTIQLAGDGISFSVTVGRDYGSHEDWNGGENTRKLKFQIFDENDNVLAESSEMTRYSIAENFNVDLTGKQ